MTKETFKEKIVSLFTKNLWLKIISLLLAILTWFAVVNITDPSVKQTFRNVQVSIVNSSSITTQGKTLEILDGSDVVSTVTIKAPRSIIQELENSSYSISVTADMNNLSSDQTTVPLEVTTTKYADKVESIRMSSEQLKVSIEDRKTIQLPISATTSGSLESGYILGTIEQAQNQVTVSGPESVIDSIETASVNVEVTGFTDTISTSAAIVLYDAEGTEIPDDNLTLNITSVKVEVPILETKKVSVTYSCTGTPAEGCELTGEIESDIDEIVIAGKADAIEDISEITIPADALNVAGLSTSLHAVVNIAKYLPTGVSLADSASGKANVVVYIESRQEKTYSVYLRNIEVLNIPDGFEETEWDNDEDYVEFTLVGLAQNLEKVQLSELNFSVDFSDYELMNEVTGYNTKDVYELPLLMELPDGVTVRDTVMVGVKLVK